MGFSEQTSLFYRKRFGRFSMEFFEGVLKHS